MTNAERWNADHGDSTLKVTYPLTPASTVFDVGGYYGDWAHAINAKYGCYVHLFEPVEKFYNSCRERFAGNGKIVCHNFGLWSHETRMPFRISGDASSVYGSHPNTEIQLYDIAQVVRRFPHVDLLSLNCEGGEYPALERLLDMGLIERFVHIQVQFHCVFLDALGTRDRIRQRLTLTHEESWCYPLVWESWKRMMPSKMSQTP